MELVVGRVVKSHGIKGELVVDVRTDEPEARFAVGAVLRGRLPRGTVTTEYTVEAAREHTGRLLLRLRGVDGRDTADALRGVLFLVDSEALGSTGDPDEFYDHELEGLRARLVGGADLGVVREVLHTAAGELLAVDVPAGEGTRQVLVPFVAAIVTEVSREGGYLVVDPPEGLLEL